MNRFFLHKWHVCFLLFLFLSCAHGDYSIEPVQLRDLSDYQDPIGTMRIRTVEIQPSQDWKEERFVMRDRAKRNLAAGIETVLWSTGYEPTQDEIRGGLALDATYRNNGSAAGCTGAWNDGYLDVRIHRGEKLMIAKTYHAKRRGSSGYSACTKVVQVCLETFSKDLASSHWRHRLKNPEPKKLEG